MPSVIGLALIASHFVSDFLLQSGFVEDRNGLRLVRHAVVVALTSGAALLWLERRAPSGLDIGLAAGLAACVGLAHGAWDLVGAWFHRTARSRWPPLIRLAVDQAGHLAVLWGLTGVAGYLPRAMPAVVGVGSKDAAANAVLWSVVFLTLGTAVTAVLIAHLLEPYRVAMIRESAAGTEEEGDLLPKAGLWIGLCERFLLILAIATGTDVVPAVGLLMGLKSIYRFRDLERRVRAEYYLLGTLLSVTAAVVFGIALRWALSMGLVLM